ncbi:MAG: Spy/CpxP family protein refolding chaperone [Bacteroidales bacterium]|nr:Spy/CpxP family protein refolding chaperone [Bacteroidales bacterium]
MKTNKILTGILAVVLLVGMSFTADAQRGQRMNNGAGQGYGQGYGPGQGFNQGNPGANCAFLNLSDEQQAKVTDLRLALTEKNLPLRNQLGEMRAKMQSLRVGDNQDFKAISKLIDEMSAVQAQVRKNAAEHRLAVRALLTDDQKVLFDARQGRQGNFKNGMRGKRGGMQRANCPGGFGFGLGLNQ